MRTARPRTRAFKWDASEVTRQEAQKSLRNQLRKNPHRIEHWTLAGLARPGVRTHGFFCRRHKSNSSGRSFGSGVRASRVPFAGRAACTTEPMARHTNARQEYSRRSSTGTNLPRVPVVPASSQTDGNSQTAGRRLDTSLSSRGSRGSQRWYRHVERYRGKHTYPTSQNYGNYGNSRENTLPVLRFVSSRRFRTQWELRELGGGR